MKGRVIESKAIVECVECRPSKHKRTVGGIHIGSVAAQVKHQAQARAVPVRAGLTVEEELQVVDVRKCGPDSDRLNKSAVRDRQVEQIHLRRSYAVGVDVEEVAGGVELEEVLAPTHILGVGVVDRGLVWGGHVVALKGAERGWAVVVQRAAKHEKGKVQCSR